MRRRTLLAGAAAWLAAAAPIGSGTSSLMSGGALLTSGPALSWQPPSSLGINVIYGNFWNDGTGAVPPVSPVQWDALFPFGVSWIRNTINYYIIGGGVSTGLVPGCDFAVRAVQSFRPYAGDPTQLELTVDAYTYVLPAGETIVLSAPLTYGTVTLPAQTPLVITGGTQGTVDAVYNSLTPSTIRVAAGATLTDTGAVAASNVTVLHANFFKSGTTPRGQVAGYVAAVNAWLAAGWWIDHAGPHDQMYTLIKSFGQAAHDALREQEWAYFASQNWPANRVLISAANEIAWFQTGGTAWQQGYGAYFQGTLYPRMRAHWPQHTLGFGNGWYDGASYLDQIKWWPADTNVVLCIHAYLDQPGGFFGGVDGTDQAAMDNAMRFIAGTQKRLRIAQVYWQEYGLLNTATNRAARLTMLRQAILANGWIGAPWGASNPGDGDEVLLKTHGVWRVSADGAGAIGLY